MARARKTRSPQYVKLSERRLRQIEGLVDEWNFETRLFMLRRLRQYLPTWSNLDHLKSWLRRTFHPAFTGFEVLRNIENLNDWRYRFEVSGSRNVSHAWNRILRREMSWNEMLYLRFLLGRETNDIFVPPQFVEIFDRMYHAHLMKEYTGGLEAPRAPLLLIIGSSGSGKTATIRRTVEEVIFMSEVRPAIDLIAKRNEVMDVQPLWRSLEDVDPELAVAIERSRMTARLQFLSKVPVVRYLFRNAISQALSSIEEEGIWVDYAVVTPNDYQTAMAGEPGNFLRKAMGEPRRTTIRHLEEAHSAFARADNRSNVQGQQASLVDASNIIIDEIISGRRDCLLIASTDRPEDIDPTIYRRFVERGLVIDTDELWSEPENLREVVRMELRRQNFSYASPMTHERTYDVRQLDRTVRRMKSIFRERSLRITPAYVRRMIESILSMKGGFKPEYLDDQYLVRDALKAVAKNVYGSIYQKVVGQMDRNVNWEDYIGSIKNDFSEMANNSLLYNVSEEKGVVLAGPPGSGKTFMVRSWLGDNHDVQDLVVNLNDLADPVNPVEGMVENLEKVYDVAKMLSPAMVFFDEGDAVAPRRSQQGGNPYDKVTNKFLTIIDGESPLSRVFTVLTTNRLDILDPALIRSKRLKVLSVTGAIREEDAEQIMAKELKGLPLDEGVTYGVAALTAKSVCDTPADFTAFAEKVRTQRTTEIRVLEKLKVASQGDHDEREHFIRFNYRILLGLISAVGVDPDLLHRAQQGETELLGSFDRMAELLNRHFGFREYPVTIWHLQLARQDLASSPTKKGKQQLDEFLETELSVEPQVGFVVGVGANDTTGVLLPIATAMVYNLYPDRILVTGAVSPGGAAAADLEMAVQMTRQSSLEALTLVEQYLSSLAPDINVPRYLGQFLDGYTIHHQLLSTSYSVGGPSAGFALAINTLSVLLNLPVMNDFGITGAPWIKGARQGEIGASVIIGGHHKKTEKVLQYLEYMYMPRQNYRDLEPEMIDAYRLSGKDIVGVGSFSGLVPEIFAIGGEHKELLSRFRHDRIRVEQEIDPQVRSALRARLDGDAVHLRTLMEREIVRRIERIVEWFESGRQWTSIAGIFGTPGKPSRE